MRSVIGYCRCNALNSKVEIIVKKIVYGCVKGKRESCIAHERESYVLGPVDKFSEDYEGFKE